MITYTCDGDGKLKVSEEEMNVKANDGMVVKENKGIGHQLGSRRYLYWVRKWGLIKRQTNYHGIPCTDKTYVPDDCLWGERVKKRQGSKERVKT